MVRLVTGCAPREMLLCGKYRGELMGWVEDRADDLFYELSRFVNKPGNKGKIPSFIQFLSKLFSPNYTTQPQGRAGKFVCNTYVYF